MATIDVVKQVLGETLQLGNRADNFTASTPLLGSIPELDSMAVVTVITALEDRFDIFVEDDEISADAFETVGTLTAFVDEKLAG
ncbi:MAG: phosphopantetheine-binding protein [Rhodospirillaceae bacterium]